MEGFLFYMRPPRLLAETLFIARSYWGKSGEAATNRKVESFLVRETVRGAQVDDVCQLLVSCYWKANWLFRHPHGTYYWK
jgi:hypothetical protein